MKCDTTLAIKDHPRYLKQYLTANTMLSYQVLSHLTPRELELFCVLDSAGGYYLPREEIANIMHIAPASVGSVVAHLQRAVFTTAYSIEHRWGYGYRLVVG